MCFFKTISHQELITEGMFIGKPDTFVQLVNVYKITLNGTKSQFVKKGKRNQ